LHNWQTSGSSLLPSSQVCSVVENFGLRDACSCCHPQINQALGY
jgi:hypothetical protein